MTSSTFPLFHFSTLIPFVPGRTAIVVLGASTLGVLVALLAGVTAAMAVRAAMAVLGGLILATAWDYAATLRAWRQSTPTMRRQLPAAFAIGITRPVHLTIDSSGPDTWDLELFDHADPTLHTEGLPIRATVPGGARLDTTYSVVPTSRGEVSFAEADVRVRSRWGLCELLERIGTTDRRRVYPDFAQVARYAWLAGDRRLQEIGIKTYPLRGQGTDFKQLSEYRVGDSVRHIDWRATLRLDKPIVREFQDERDQCVMLLVDCGRRMRADDRTGAIGTTHFD